MPASLKYMKTFLKKLSQKLLPESATDRVLVYIVAVILLSIIVVAAFFNRGNKGAELITPEQALNRDYYRSPLNMSDAYQYCVLEAEKQLGAAILRYSMDEISSHYKEDKKLFFIVLKADVGSIDDYREASIYCNVDPRQYKVSYYKEVYPGEDRSILSRTIEFFSRL